MNIGFTGTRNGMNADQHELFGEHVARRGCSVFRHGACVGADEHAAEHVAKLMVPPRIIAHPGRSAKGGDNEFLSRRALDLSDEVLPADTHFARNRAIVDASDLIIAVPWQRDRPAKGTGGGTW